MTKSGSNSIDNSPQKHPIGVVTYRLAGDSGELTANWAFSAQDGVDVICRGIAVPKGETTDLSKTAFTGLYSITYYDPDDKPAEPWDLEITQKGELFAATWSKQGYAFYHGIGFRADDLLVCGWRPSE